MIAKIKNALEWRFRYYNENLKQKNWKKKLEQTHANAKKVEGITLVVVGRNDNYGGDFSKRLETTIDWNLKHLPNPELIYVEWNPVLERESDCDWISKRYKNSKCYIVPNEIHQKYCDNPKLPVMEYFAKNMGIRRAENDWILLVNADVLIGLNTIKNIKYLNEDYVYSTHYNNIDWDQKPITERHLTDENIVLNYFSSDDQLSGLVGNMILAHKKMWFKARGYDESLTDVRKGVDSNGLLQLFHHGAKPMVLGDHFHLDHQESLIHGGNSTHGFNPKIENGKNIPYHNSDDWGLIDYKIEELSNNVWKLKEI